MVIAVSKAYCENETQTVPGGATIQALLSNLESAAAKQNIQQFSDRTSGNMPVLQAGVGYIYADRVKVLQLPVSYNINKNSISGLSIPYLYKRKKGYFEDEEIENEGIGDVSVFFEQILTKEKFHFSGRFTLKAPTGYYKRFENNRETIPLGTGSYDFIISGGLIYKPDLSPKIRITASSSYRLNGKSSYKEEATFSGYTTSYNFKEKNGNVFSFSVGSIFFSNAESLLFYGDLDYMTVQRGTISYSDPYNIVSLNQTRKDSLSTVNLTLGSKYGVSDRSAFRVGVTLPIWTAYDDDAGEIEKRQATGDFGVDYLF